MRRFQRRAFWFDHKTGSFISSTYYFSGLPSWAREFNDAHPADHYKGAHWLSGHFDQTGEKLYNAVYDSPFGNELVEAFAERAVEAEKLGQRGVTDLLTISFSSNDAVGHALGPDSPEVHDISVRTIGICDLMRPNPLRNPVFVKTPMFLGVRFCG